MLITKILGKIFDIDDELEFRITFGYFVSITMLLITSVITVMTQNTTGRIFTMMSLLGLILTIIIDMTTSTIKRLSKEEVED